MSAVPPPAAVTADRWELMLPAGWVSLSTDPERGRGDLKKVLDRAFRGRSRDELVQLRIELDRALTEQVQRAREQGAQQVHMLIEPIAGVPVSASLIVADLEVSADDELSAVLRQVMGEAVGVLEHSRVTVAGLDGLRRVRRVEQRVDDAGPDSPPLQTTYVDYVLEPAPDRLLMLVFSTSTAAVFDEMVILFDAIASSLRPREQH